MKDLGLLMLRIAIGVPFIMHGVSKLMDIAGTTGFFAMLNLPAFMVYVVGILEILAGAMILLGFWATIGGWIMSIIMISAYVLIKYKTPFFGGWELDMIFFFSGIAIAMLGSGKYSIKKDSCCNTCTTKDAAALNNTNNCTHMNCECGDCEKC
jgi:putative oxidoreductase